MPDIIRLRPSRIARLISSGTLAAGSVFVLFVAGTAFGADGNQFPPRQPSQQVAMLQPAPVAELREDAPAAIKGEVAEIFGGKFILQDGSGRALVDTGLRGERRAIVAKGETVTVEGWFDGGFIRARAIRHADGRSDNFGPPGPPPDGPMRGRAGMDGPPPPPPPYGRRADRYPPPPPPPPPSHHDYGPEDDGPPPPLPPR